MNTIIVLPDPVTAAGGSGGSIGIGSGDRQIAFSVRGGTISEILDKMCLMSEFKIWVVCYPDSLTRTITGFARTTTLMRDLTVDDRFQPTWVFLEWEPSGVLH